MSSERIDNPADGRIASITSARRTEKGRRGRRELAIRLPAASSLRIPRNERNELRVRARITIRDQRISGSFMFLRIIMDIEYRAPRCPLPAR